jgi:hypothetical protein
VRLILALIALSMTAESSFAQSACTHYASPSGGGNGLGQSSPFRISDFWNTSSLPGKTLCLLDGTYTGGSNMIDPPAGLSGTSSARITIRALNDGKVLIDGQFVSGPLALDDHNSYWTIEGINFRNGVSGVVFIACNSDFNIIRRVVAWDSTWNSNNSVIGVGPFGSYGNVLEDVAAFGVGRKTIATGQSVWDRGDGHCKGVPRDNTIMRRIWAQGHGSGEDGHSVVDTYYNSYGVLWENVLASADWKYVPSTWQRTSLGIDKGSTNGGNYTTINGGRIIFEGHNDNGNTCSLLRVLGALAYLKSDYIHHSGTGTPLIQHGGWRGDCITLRDIMAYLDPGNDRFYNYSGFILSTPYEAAGLNDSAQRLTAVSGRSNFYDPVWHATGISEGQRVGDVVSPWSASGTSGARLCYRYENGVLQDGTNGTAAKPLWPWPMNERIRQATAMAGVYNPPSCLGCSGGRAPRVAIDVTADMEGMFGPIPAQCRSSGLPVPSPSPTPAPSPVFTIGQRVEVNPDQVNLYGPAKVRVTPDGTLLGTQPAGTLGTISGGPISAGGITWFQVNYDTGMDGWTPDGMLMPSIAPVPAPVVDSDAPIVTITSPANGTVVPIRSR